MRNQTALSTSLHLPNRMLRHLLTVVALIACPHAPGLEPSASTIQTCDTASNARIGQAGVTYRGTVSNSDYRFRAIIPEGFTGLGAAPGAPFHGFTIYLSRSACIVFEIEQVHFFDEGTSTGPKHPARGTPMRVGNREGQRHSLSGATRGRSYLNTEVLLELPRSGYKNGVSIRFVTPLEDRSVTEPVFRAFLASFRFY